jgi:Xaa-Pro aminopeptidase
MTSRLRRLRSQFASLNIDAFFVTFQPHLRYLSGFAGSSGIGIVTGDASYLITDSRYAEQIKQEVKSWKCRVANGTLLDEVFDERILRPSWRVGFDGNTVVLSQYQLLKKRFPKTKFLPKVDCIEKIAAVKDAREIASIRKAAIIGDRVFSEVLPLIKPGVAELDISAEISYRQKRLGSEADAFETIVASGERSALPHGRASAKKLSRGELVTLDFGCVVDGYHSDMTRTVALGIPKPEAKKIYATVLTAQRKAIEAARSGMKTKELDAVARSHIRQCGYEAYFRHSLGHGLGLQIHEAPRISVQSLATLEAGNVITIEPGIYLPRFGGVRIEDDVVITNGSCDVLNRSSKELLVL